jgi:Putative amidoligase enzyme
MASTELKQVYDIFKNAPGSKISFGDRHRGEFGVEIETETSKAYDYPPLKMWNTVKDNSLRDWGVEYVLKSPVNIPDLERALEEFAVCEKKYKFNKGSISTSVHVHVNFMNETFLTLANLFTIYALMENLLIRYSGPERLSNLFCLPMIDAEGVADYLKDVLAAVAKNQWNRCAVPNDKVKYGAINPAPLTKLGTIEFRSFRGETDTNLITRWVFILKKMKEFAKTEGLTPPAILKMWHEYRHSLIDIVFAEYAKEIKASIRTGETVNGLIESNLKFAAEFATVTKLWSNFGILKVKPIYVEKAKAVLNTISQERFNMPFDDLPYHERILAYEIFQRMNPSHKIVELTEDM